MTRTRPRLPDEQKDADLCLVKGCDQPAVLDKYRMGFWCADHDEHSEADARDEAACARWEMKEDR